MKELIYYTTFYRKKVVCSIVIVMCCTNVFSQGTWDIKYISLGTLNASFIGQEIRIDFKASDVDTVNGEVKVFAIRKLLSTKDTVSLSINNKSVEFIEHWKFYVDHGVLADQYLESLSKEVKKRIYIKGMFLESINNDSLVFQAIVCDPNSKSEVKQRIVISKSVIKGLLVSGST